MSRQKIWSSSNYFSVSDDNNCQDEEGEDSNDVCEELNTPSARCGVCEIPLKKPTTHYGGNIANTKNK